MSIKKFKLDCVLLIDDDEATNFYHTIVLEDECTGVQIKSVKSAKEGLNFLMGKGIYADDPQPGIIFLDINMPGMTGWDFLADYNKLSANIQERTVVTILTTSMNPDDRDRASSIPVVKEFINKPLTAEAFWKVVNENFT